MRDIEQPYDDAYVEFFGLRSGMGAVPYLHWASSPGPSSATLNDFQRLWFKNKDTSNYLHLIGAENRYAAQPTYAGWTLFDPVSHMDQGATFIWVQEIEAKFSSADAPVASQYTAVHEMTHNFSINGYSIDTYHCANMAYPVSTDIPAPHECVMNGTYIAYRGQPPRFCVPHLFTGGSSLTEVQVSIRNQIDPLPY